MRAPTRCGRVMAIGALAALGTSALMLLLAVEAVGAPPADTTRAAPTPAPTPAPVTDAQAAAADAELMPSPYTYEVRGRRDPFRSLLIRKQVERSGIAGPAGMTVDELELQGTIKMKAGWIAMMRGSDNRSYLLKKGTVLFDGEVTGISSTDVSFRQNVNDPASPKPFRDVVKSLALQQKP
jgi:hypothetical protein